MRMLSDRRVWYGLWVVMLLTLMTATSALAQATSTFNGRVLDQGDAVLPGVTVTVTNQNTGVVRTTVSNEEGLYFLPGPRARRLQDRDRAAGLRAVDARQHHAGGQRDPHARFHARAVGRR